MDTPAPLTLPTQPILVTGAAGFIGAQVCATLLAQGATVVGVDNMNDAYDPRLKDWRLAHLQGHAGFRFLRLDIADYATLEQEVFNGEPFGAVINLAARAGVRQSVANPWVYVETNITGTLNLLELCQRTGVTKFVLASTSSLYGGETPRPFREDAATDGPLSPYAASKKGAESFCYAYHHLYGIDVTVLRYFTVYGPAGRPDMSMFRFVQWISEGRLVTVFGDGEQERDFTYVEDIARGTVAALRPLGYEVINLGSDTPIKLMDTIRLIEEILEQPAQLEFRPAHRADMQATWASIDKAARMLGWRPQTRFADGIAALVAWYRAEREWAREVETGR
jgi:nucleoside-diphosphate-sugar epimerase